MMSSQRPYFVDCERLAPSATPRPLVRNTLGSRRRVFQPIQYRVGLGGDTRTVFVVRSWRRMRKLEDWMGENSRNSHKCSLLVAPGRRTAVAHLLNHRLIAQTLRSTCHTATASRVSFKIQNVGQIVFRAVKMHVCTSRPTY